MDPKDPTDSQSPLPPVPPVPPVPRAESPEAPSSPTAESTPTARASDSNPDSPYKPPRSATRQRYLVPKKQPDLSKLRASAGRAPVKKSDTGDENAATEPRVSKAVQRLREKRKRILGRDPTNPPNTPNTPKKLSFTKKPRPKGTAPKTRLKTTRPKKRQRIPFRPVEPANFQNYRKFVYLPPVYFFFDVLWGVMTTAGDEGALKRYYGMFTPFERGGIEGTFAVDWVDRLGYILMLKSSVPYLSFVNWIMWGLTIVAMVWWVRYLARGWELIQNTKPGISPRRAVIGLFIPVYNLFWYFTATLGLCRRYNEMVEPDLRCPRMDPTLFYTQLLITFFAIGALALAVMLQFQYLNFMQGIDTSYPINKFSFRAAELGMRTFFLGMFVGGAGIETVCRAINAAARSKDPRDHVDPTKLDPTRSDISNAV